MQTDTSFAAVATQIPPTTRESRDRPVSRSPAAPTRPHAVGLSVISGPSSRGMASPPRAQLSTLKALCCMVKVGRVISAAIALRGFVMASATVDEPSDEAIAEVG